MFLLSYFSSLVTQAFPYTDTKHGFVFLFILFAVVTRWLKSGRNRISSSCASPWLRQGLHRILGDFLANTFKQYWCCVNVMGLAFKHSNSSISWFNSICFHLNKSTRLPLLVKWHWYSFVLKLWTPLIIMWKCYYCEMITGFQESFFSWRFCIFLIIVKIADNFP